LFNHLLCLQKPASGSDLEVALKACLEVLGNKEADNDTLMAVLMCECRIFYKNIDACALIEGGAHKSAFCQTHVQLRQRSGDQAVQEACQDVVGMVDLTKK
jgi:hypothetical protein